MVKRVARRGVVTRRPTEHGDAISNIIERVPESDALCMGISMRWASSRGAGQAVGGRGGLQSRSLTWGARVMFKRQFWHPADPAPTFFNRRRAPTLGRRHHPFGILMSLSRRPSRPRGVASPATDR